VINLGRLPYIQGKWKFWNVCFSVRKGIKPFDPPPPPHNPEQPGEKQPMLTQDAQFGIEPRQIGERLGSRPCCNLSILFTNLFLRIQKGKIKILTYYKKEKRRFTYTNATAKLSHFKHNVIINIPALSVKKLRKRMAPSLAIRPVSLEKLNLKP